MPRGTRDDHDLQHGELLALRDSNITGPRAAMADRGESETSNMKITYVGFHGAVSFNGEDMIYWSETKHGHGTAIEVKGNYVVMTSKKPGRDHGTTCDVPLTNVKHVNRGESEAPAKQVDAPQVRK